MAVDIGKKMHAEAAGRRASECIHCQARAEVGSADADADDVGDIGRCQCIDQRAHLAARLQRLRMRGLRHR